MPTRRPSYAICPGDRIEVEVVQPDGGRALVVGKLDKVPEAAGGRATTAALLVIQPHRSAAESTPRTAKWIRRTVAAESGVQTCGWHSTTAHPVSAQSCGG